MYEYLTDPETGHALIVKDDERWAEFADRDFGKWCYEFLMQYEVAKLRKEMKKE